MPERHGRGLCRASRARAPPEKARSPCPKGRTRRRRREHAGYWSTVQMQRYDSPKSAAGSRGHGGGRWSTRACSAIGAVKNSPGAAQMFKCKTDCSKNKMPTRKNDPSAPCLLADQRSLARPDELPRRARNKSGALSRGLPVQQKVGVQQKTHKERKKERKKESKNGCAMMPRTRSF